MIMHDSVADVRVSDMMTVHIIEECVAFECILCEY